MAPLPLPSRLVHSLEFHKGPVHTCSFNTGSTYLLSGGSDRQIRLSNPQTGVLVKSYSGHAYEVLSIACTKDNTKFASSGGDRNVFLWDVMEGDILRRFAGHLGKVNTVCWNDTASVLASGSFDTTIRLWDAKSSNRIPIQVLEDAKDSITSIVIRDHLIIAGSVDGYLRTWDLRMGQLSKDFFDQPITSLTLSKTSSSLILLSLLSLPPTHPSHPPQVATHHLFDFNLGQSLNHYRGHKNSNYQIQSSFSGASEECVYGGDEEGIVRCWDTESGELVGGGKKGELKAHERSCLGVLMHPKERRMVTWGQDGFVKIWGD
ncbi:hypothetical protein JCM16303_001479 [Sporobolomyces ruberrimus]